MLVKCELTGKEVPEEQAREGFTIRPSMFKAIQQIKPGFTEDSWISNEELRKLKLEYNKTTLMEDGLDSDTADLISKAVANHDFLSTDHFNESNKPEVKKTMADRVAAFAGSWRFPAVLLTSLALWMTYNRFDISKVFDSYQFNVVDLGLALVTLIQALFIMISQRKEATRDRQESLNSFKVNMKNELELMILREKINHVTRVQNPQIHKDLEEIINILKTNNNE